MTSRIFLFFFSCWMMSVSIHAAPPVHSKEVANVGVATTTNAVVLGASSLPTPHLHATDLKPILSRILEATLDRNDDGSHASTMQSLARTLSALQPTLVSGLVQVSAEGALRVSQQETFLTIRKEVLAANPRCKFDVSINGSKYPTATEFLNKLQEINAKLAPDILRIVIPFNNEVVYPSVLARGIEYAHAHGELVSYEGPMSMIPDGVDFLVLRAWNGEVRREEISSLKTRHRLPIVVQIPASVREEDRHTALLLTHLAEEQAPYGYHLAYPINNPLLSSGVPDAKKDVSFLVTLRALMTRFN